MVQTSVPPVDYEAEGRVVGALLLSPEQIPDIMGKLSAIDFANPAAKYVYDAMCTLDMEGKPVSAETVYQKLTTIKTEMGKPAASVVGSSSNIIDFASGVDPNELMFWADEVKSKSEQRLLLDYLEKSRERVLRASGSIKSLRSSLEEGLVSLGGESSPDSAPIGADMDKLYARLDKYMNDPDSIAGLASGWKTLDRNLDGFQKGNVTIVYAPTSRFKSLWTSNLGWKFALQGHGGLWFTTEMPVIQVKERLLQIESGLNIKFLRREQKLKKYEAELTLGVERLKEYPIFFNDTSSLDVSSVRAEVSRHKRWNNIEYVIVDLVDHIYSSRFRDEMINNQRMVMQAMKGIAKDFDVHIILVSHVRKSEKDLKNSADLDLDEMTGTAAKGQDVDVAISLMPVVWDYEEGNWSGMSRHQIMEAMFDRELINILVSVSKNRHGELFRYVMVLDLDRGGRIEPSVENNFYEDNPYLKKREQRELFDMDE